MTTPPCSSWPGRSSVSGWASADFPGVVAGQQGGEVTGTAPAPGRVDLLRHQLVVAGLLHLPEDADRGVPEVRRVQPRPPPARRAGRSAGPGSRPRTGPAPRARA